MINENKNDVSLLIFFFEIFLVCSGVVFKSWSGKYGGLICFGFLREVV